MKIVFAGSPEFAVPALEKLLDGGKEIVAVITQPDRPVGRKRIFTPTPVKKFALERGLKVYDFKKIRDNVGVLESLAADIMITCAYGQILSKEVLDVFKGGVWNIHASLLPKFRGASPIQSAILAGETHTGVTVMKTELELDSGDMLLVKRCEIGDCTCGELTKKLSLLGADAALEAVELLEKGDRQLLMQSEADVTFCKKISKSDAKLDFNESANAVYHKVKAFSPEPAAYCQFNGSPLNILDCQLIEAHGKCGEVVAADKRGILVACVEGGILITNLQPSGGKVMRACDFVNGRKIKAGDILE